MNSVNLIGRLTKDPVLKKTPSNKSYTSFAIAVQRDENTADFPNIVAWDKTAEIICSYFNKGSMIGIEGEVRTRSYDSTTIPNRKEFVTEFLARRVSFCDSKSKTETTQQDVQPVVSNGLNITADDLPF